ncbi:hypothetical protein AMAG_20068 [Allomyces macrogynus ATCC 38327]|uniref:Uncharacterized protein n=1 Tax=Allomyces macrogynus (strain ATCC 38327) TaxID=578462 RepID=A0A0L0T656_ALLM3|nr:hypothetical protein AMAG_20068 [Allomyces macrogynus ATCC 38327]|eukprot:KNE70242.1 hypothetical protein AMAG_20068 [Allomyces macrogynus ATCC 38327]
MPADRPYNLTPATVDASQALQATGTVPCPSCNTNQTMDVLEYAGFRLHDKFHVCSSCSTSFPAKHVAVCRFMVQVAQAQQMLRATVLHGGCLAAN